MKTVKLNGKEYPYKFTIGAAKKFKEKFDVNVTQVDPNDLEQLQHIVFYGMQSGSKVEGKDFDLTIDALEDLDIEELADLVSQTSSEKKP